MNVFKKIFKFLLQNLPYQNGYEPKTRMGLLAKEIGELVRDKNEEVTKEYIEREKKSKASYNLPKKA
jgi:hypothetical protein